MNTSKLTDYKADKHLSCSVQKLGTYSDNGLAWEAYHCVDHNVDFKRTIAVERPAMSKQSLDSILKAYRDFWLDPKPSKIANTAQTKQAIVEAVEGLIVGEDVIKINDMGLQDAEERYKNKLRAEQRQAIKEWQNGR